MEKAYNPSEIEERLQKQWQDQQLFVAPESPRGETYSVVMPPPNVTGILHMGHAMDNTLQDVLVRWQRLKGLAVLWLPGTDHAGIATQNVVEQHLREQEGISRHDLGREEFVQRVWQWKEQYRDRIIGQLNKLGISCDWSRERFTLDDGCSQAVQETFIQLYKKGLIYRGDYMVNWCPRCQTALSDIEVEHEEADAKLWHVRYPLAEGEGHVVVATTRPETMLGDTAVAVHPGDSRYSDYIGKEVVLPVMDRKIPVIADEQVDPEFGTGAVKVTPAHDPNDFEMGQRHNLPHVVVIDTQGKMTGAAGKYAGRDRYACRKELVAELEQLGLLEKVEEHRHAAGHCQRCDTVVEPLVSTQWFVKMKPLAKPAIEAVRQGDTRFVPPRFEKIYFNWLESIRDWCISRQLWWGHRIPAWHCRCGEMVVATEKPDRCPECGSTKMTQDPDVLDTWFSSALWPFSTLGWPEETEDLKNYFPTSVLVTAYDIIFFWVARMMFMSLELTGQAPFKDVYIHGLVRDEQGRKMSKSLGNGIDPLDVIKDYGADTLRFVLVTGAAPGNDIRFQQERVDGARNFANKIWNAARFVLMNLDDAPETFREEDLDIASRWILHRFAQTAEKVDANLEKYELGEAAREIYEFLWNHYCDWYIEAAKLGLQDEKRRGMTQAVLRHVLSGALQLLHPFMPFITEELWHSLGHSGSIALSQWPKLQAGEAGEFEVVMETVRAIRNIRSEMDVNPGKFIPALLYTGEKISQEARQLICHLARLEKLDIIADGEKPKDAMSRVIPLGEVLVPLSGAVDVAQERQRLATEKERLDKEVARLEKKLANPGFVKKAPREVVEQEQEKLAGYIASRELVEKRRALLEEGN